MIRLFGWVRLEVHSLIDFETVTEKELQSIMRKSCVIKAFARFFDTAYLDHHGMEDAARYGRFPRKVDLTEKFQTGVYHCAFNRLQQGWEAENNVDDCYKEITNFTRNGGDDGITERFIRHSCNLPKTMSTNSTEQRSRSQVCPWRPTTILRQDTSSMLKFRPSCWTHIPAA